MDGIIMELVLQICAAMVGTRAAAVRQKCPATIFLISGIFPLVPGAGIYWTVYYLITEQLRLAVYTGYEAVKVAIAIVLGIVVVFELPQGWFWWAVKKCKSSAMT